MPIEFSGHMPWSPGFNSTAWYFSFNGSPPADSFFVGQGTADAGPSFPARWPTDGDRSTLQAQVVLFIVTASWPGGGSYQVDLYKSGSSASTGITSFVSGANGRLESAVKLVTYGPTDTFGIFLRAPASELPTTLTFTGALLRL